MLKQLAEWFAGGGTEALQSLAFEFNTPLGFAACLLLMAATGAAAAWFYAPRIQTLPPRSWWTVLLLRTVLILLLVFLLLDPTLVGKRVTPGEQSVILLFDDSKSMQITDEAGVSRGARLKQALQHNQETFLKPLKELYQVLSYRFGESIERLAEANALTFERSQSDLLGALEAAAREWQGVDLAAMVLFSDGAQQTTDHRAATEIDHSVLGDTPVMTVGVGREAAWRDVAIERMSVKRTHFDKSPVIVSADVKASGLAGYKAKVDVLENGQIAKSETLPIEREHQILPVRLEFIPTEKGWVDCTLRVRLIERQALQQQETPDRIEENNRRRFVVDNNDKQYRVLYVSGRPNWEQKFVGRALMADEQLKLTRLIRISAAEKKFEYRGERTSTTNPLFQGFDDDESRYGRYDESIFLRMGADESELTKGFPSDATELFEYELVIFGEAERELFTTTQLELVREFVSKRGGAFLMLGGPRAFQHGGYKGSPIENMLPVLMRDERADHWHDTRGQNSFLVLPTLEGDISGAFLLEKDRSVSQNRWGDMPMLYGLNAFAMIRAGASVWLRSLHKERTLHDKAVFAVQRYGRGRSAVLATGSTWPWHFMTEDEPSPHHRVWRQIIRSLIYDAPQPIELRAKQEAYPVDRPVTLETVIRDTAFDPQEGGRVSIIVTTPSGKEMSLPVDESIQQPGIYRSEFTPEEPGHYRVAIQARNANNENLGRVEESILAQADHQEWQKPDYNPAFLQSLAQDTGGGFIELAQLDGLAGRIPAQPTEEAQIVRIHLWHWWGFYLLLPLLMTIEWYIRRKRGLA